MIRDNNASGLIPLSERSIEKLGFKDFRLKAQYNKYYVLEWSPSSQAYQMGIQDIQTGEFAWFCWDLKFVHELERLLVALRGE